MIAIRSEREGDDEDDDEDVGEKKGQNIRKTRTRMTAATRVTFLLIIIDRRWIINATAFVQSLLKIRKAWMISCWVASRANRRHLNKLVALEEGRKYSHN